MAEQSHTAVQVENNSGPPPNLLQTKENEELADSSRPLFSMYHKMTEEEDKEMAKRWQKDADGIIIFTGLFSAAVAALLTVSVAGLKQDPQDISAFYLENMYKLQVLADPNISRPSIPSTPVQPPPFSPPKYVIWVNSLWFLSLVISLTCAMLATLLQQWARRYLRLTQPLRYSPHRRAGICTFYVDGVDKLRLAWVVEALPSMIHLSLFLFFTGLLIYLFNVSHPVFFAVIWWVGISAVAYLGITFMPIFRLESPYYTPLTSIVGLLHIREKMAEKAVQKMRSKIDGRILEWTCETLVEDGELEKFFEMIPDFCNSDTDQDPPDLSQDGFSSMSRALFRFLFRSFISNSLSESDKIRRFVIGVKAADAVRLPSAAWITLMGSASGAWDRILYSAEVAESLKSGDKHGHRETNMYAWIRGNPAWIISCLLEGLVKPTTNLFDRDLPRYLRHGKDNMSLANLIHISRFNFRSLGYNQNVTRGLSIPMVQLPSNYNIRNALPELQQKFCALWNEIVSDVQNHANRDSAIKILVRIRHLYIDLHQGTDAAPTAFDASTIDQDPILRDPSSYPLCHSDHHSRVDDNATTIPLPAPNPTPAGTHLTDMSASKVPGTSTCPIPATKSSGPVSQSTNIPSQASQDIAADTTERIVDIPSQAKPILQPNLGGGASLQATDQTPAAIVSPAVIPDSPPLMLAPSSPITEGLHSPTECPVNESDRIPHEPVSSSSSPATAFSRVAPQVASSSDHTAISSQSDVQDANVPIQSELTRNPASDHSAT